MNKIFDLYARMDMFGVKEKSLDSQLSQHSNKMQVHEPIVIFCNTQQKFYFPKPSSYLQLK